MAVGRSFAEYVKDKCCNGLYGAAENYVNENWESMNLFITISRRKRKSFSLSLSATMATGTRRFFSS